MEKFDRVQFTDLPEEIQARIGNLKYGLNENMKLMETREDVEVALSYIHKILNTEYGDEIENEIFKDYVTPAVNEGLKIILRYDNGLEAFLDNAQRFIDAEASRLTLNEVNLGQRELIREAFKVFGCEFGEVIANGLINNAMDLTDHLLEI